MNRKLSLATLALLLALCLLAGCSAQSVTPTTGAPPAGTSAAAPEAASAAPAPAAPAKAAALKVALVGQKPNDEQNVLAAVNAKLTQDGSGLSVSTIYMEDYWKKLALAIAGGDELDVAWAHVNTLSDLVSKGVYQPIGDVFAQAAPDIAASIPASALKTGSIGDQLYALSRIIPMAEYNWVYNIRGDLRAKYGLDPITTLEGLEAYFDKALEDGMVPTADHNLQPLYPVFANYYFPLGDAGIHPFYVDPTDPTHTVKSFFASDAFIQAVNTKRDWRAKGYIVADESRFDGAHNGFIYGIVACVPSNTLSETERIDSILANLPDAIIETVLLNPEPLYLYTGGDNMLAVPSSSKQVAQGVSFINWIKKDQANFDLWSFGVQGVNYTLDGASIAYDDISTDMQYRPNVWMWNDMSLARFSKGVPAANIERLKAWDESAIVTPYIGFVFDQSSVKAQVSQITALGDEYYGQLRSGVVAYDDVKDDFLSKLESAGIDKVLVELQTQLNAFLAP